MVFPTLIALPLSLAAAFPASFAATLEIEERKMNFLSLHTIPNCTSTLVLAGANAITRDQALKKVFRVHYVVLLQAEPQRRTFLGPTAVGTLDDALNALAGEQVMGEMHFLKAWAFPHENSKSLSADIVEPIFEELQDPKLLAPPTQLKHGVQSLGCQAILREVNFLVKIIFLLHRHFANVAICDLLLRAIELVLRAVRHATLRPHLAQQLGLSF